MEKLIKECLLANKTIVIPEIGALTITNEETREVMLLTYLKFDNKELKQIYAELNHCEFEEANNAVVDWVRQLKEDLDKGNTRTIDELGYFQKDAEGEYEFISETPTNSHVSKENTISITTESFHSIEEQKENTVGQEEIPSMEEESEDIQEPVIEEKEENSNNISLAEPEEKLQESTKEKVTDVTQTAEEKEKNDDKINRVGILILLCMVAIIGSLGYIYQENIKVFISGNKVIEEVPEEADTTSSFEEENQSIEFEDESNYASDEDEKLINPAEEMIEGKVEENTAIANETFINNSLSNQGNYHLIVGSFSVQENATQLNQDLKQKGYASLIIEKNGFYLVSMYSFETMQEASLKAKEIEDCWIFKN